MISSPDGSTIYALDADVGIFLITNNELQTNYINIAPSGYYFYKRCAAISPDGNTLYVSVINGITSASYQLLIIDLQTGTVSQTLDYNIMAPLAISPDGAYLFGMDYNSLSQETQLIYIMDTTTYAFTTMNTNIPSDSPITAFGCGCLFCQ